MQANKNMEKQKCCVYLTGLPFPKVSLLGYTCIKIKETYLNIMLIMSYSSLGAEVWHVLTRNHTVVPATHTFIHKWNEPCLPLTLSHRMLPHFGWYSFPVPLRVWGWASLGSLVKYWGGLSAGRRSPIPVCVAAAGNWTRNRRVLNPTP